MRKGREDWFSVLFFVVALLLFAWLAWQPFLQAVR